ncbi:hypothetical protein [Arcicella rigui]|uniref:Uncharacterized protein n=1 Tax=Arcicella rigui TaxID=797020 RepID=A0ABU5QA47_9BACT|nr:hypothetical protein [Arcicella rigui]MEA5139598.1 hypothetical protein [Arcicella rigui]
MKNAKLYNILDLIEEIQKVNQMIEIHSESDSDLMSSQYISQKLKLTDMLFKDLLKNSGNNTEVMYLFKLFIEKFYKNEMTHHHSIEREEALKKIESVFLEL